METLDILKDRYFKKDTTSSQRMEINRTRKAVEELCSEHLTDLNDIFQFEALPSCIDVVLVVIEQPQLASKFIFTQISETVFEVRLRELDF